MFGKLKTKTADEFLGLFKELSEEEQAKVLSSLNPPKTEDEAQIDKAEEHIEERGEEDGTKDQTEKDVEDESVGEQEHLDGNEDSQTAKDRIDESEGTEKADEAAEEPEVKDDDEDRYAALVARIDVLEEMLDNMQKAQEEAVEEEHDRDFGLSAGVPDGGQEENDRYKRVMRGYAKNNSNQYF